MERELTELAFLYSATEFGRRFPTFLPSFLCQGCRKGEKHLRMAALARGKRQHEVRTLRELLEEVLEAQELQLHAREALRLVHADQDRLPRVPRAPAELRRSLKNTLK